MKKMSHLAASLKEIYPKLETKIFPELFGKFNAHWLLATGYF